MSNLYEKYLKLKKENGTKTYLFKNGNFYVFIDEDAKKISEITTLKTTILSGTVIKCGFPINSINKYETLFKNLNVAVEIVNEIKVNTNEDIIRKLRKIDIDTITPLKAINILKELRDMLNEWIRGINNI